MKTLNPFELDFVVDQMVKSAQREAIELQARGSLQIVKPDDLEAAKSQLSRLLKEAKRVGGIETAIILLGKSKAVFEQPTLF